MTGTIAGRLTLTLLLLVAAAFAPRAQAQPAGFQKFYGEWVGTAVSDAGGEIAPRDIRTKIVPQENGFSITWVLVVHKAPGKEKRSEFSVRFQPTKRPSIYSSAMRVDMFGNPVPLDPLKGDPYVWARVDGSVLTIHALIITESGGYEMHVYERTITPDGTMNLKYSRVLDGDVLKEVTGVLKRAK